jgi:hypothetical protein
MVPQVHLHEAVAVLLFSPTGWDATGPSPSGPAAKNVSRHFLQSGLLAHFGGLTGFD